MKQEIPEEVGDRSKRIPQGLCKKKGHPFLAVLVQRKSARAVYRALCTALSGSANYPGEMLRERRGPVGPRPFFWKAAYRNAVVGQ